MLPLNANMGLVIPTPIERGTSREKKLTLIVPTQVALPKDLHVLARIPTEIEAEAPLCRFGLLKYPKTSTSSDEPIISFGLVTKRQPPTPDTIPNFELIVFLPQRDTNLRCQCPRTRAL